MLQHGIALCLSSRWIARRARGISCLRLGIPDTDSDFLDIASLKGAPDYKALAAMTLPVLLLHLQHQPLSIGFAVKGRGLTAPS